MGCLLFEPAPILLGHAARQAWKAASFAGNTPTAIKQVGSDKERPAEQYHPAAVDIDPMRSS